MKSIGINGAILFISIMTVACTRYDQVTKINNIFDAQTIVLRNVSGKGPVHSISIKVGGHIDGEATIYLMLDGKPYKTEKIENNISIAWGGDWYSDTAEIRYEPNRVKEGELIIKYRFHSIN